MGGRGTQNLQEVSVCTDKWLYVERSVLEVILWGEWVSDASYGGGHEDAALGCME